ncbi:MAG: hypothetical protein FWC89_07650 [Defluviitaleaceae bacterium]|nr:hypothetical protein [Defluviitaleaceae bacterium]
MTIRDHVIMSQNRNATDIMNRNRNGGDSSNRMFGSQGSRGRAIPDIVLRQFTRDADRTRRSINDLRDASRNICESNVDEQVQAVRRVVNSFNNMLSSSKEKGGRNVTVLEQQLINLVRDNPDELRRMGITINRDGSMRMNNSNVRTAAERGDISRIVNNTSSSSFVNSLSATANAVSRNPNAFLVISSHLRPRNVLQMW